MGIIRQAIEELVRRSCDARSDGSGNVGPSQFLRFSPYEGSYGLPREMQGTGDAIEDSTSLV